MLRIPQLGRCQGKTGRQGLATLEKKVVAMCMPFDSALSPRNLVLGKELKTDPRDVYKNINTPFIGTPGWVTQFSV